jgi:hypothetical protein
VDCPECARLSEEVWSLHAELLGAKDDLKLTPKDGPGYASKKLDVARLEALLRDAHHRSSLHTKSHRA